MKTLRIIICLLTVCCGLPAAYCQQPGYIYIQGDKQTPFYVKLEGEMQPRYGKNYSILSDLEPGPAHLEILFQQNIHPAQKFTVNVPEGGSRGFLITKNGDDFALYDLQQGTYLTSGNSEIADKLPPTKSLASTSIAPRGKTTKEKMGLPNTRREPKVKKKTEVIAQKETAKQSPVGEQFIEGVTLRNEHTATGTSAVTSPVSTTASYTPQQPAGIRNSDCPTALSKEEFSPVYKAALAEKDDESRTAYVLGQMDKCYATWQARALTSMLSTDAARFTILKRLYPRITDQASFPLLDDLLREASYKEAFNQLLHPKQ